jgi:hypothetical protein
LSSIFLVTVASVGISGFVTWFLFNKTILKWYGEEKSHSRQAKIKYWAGLIAFIYIGMGITEILGELFLSQFLGFKWSTDKVAAGALKIIAVPLLLLIVTMVAVFFTKDKKYSLGDYNIPNSELILVRKNIFKYEYFNYINLLIIISAAGILYFGYSIYQSKASKKKISFYKREIYGDCTSQFEKKPTYMIGFIYKKETGEIYKSEESNFNGNNSIELQKLSPCSVVNENNWVCGGDYYEFNDKINKAQKFTFVNGNLSYEYASGHINDCNIKYEIN